MAIEQVAGDSAGGGAPAGVDYDIGQGAMNGEGSFALPDDFEQNLDDGLELEQPIAPVPAPGQLPQPAAAPPAAPAPAPGQPQQPPAQPQPAGQPTQVPAPAAVEPGRIFSPGELAQQLGRNKDVMIDALAGQKFQLSPADVQALEVDAVGVLPKLMARVYFEATVNGLQQMANMVPRMVEHVANERIAESEAEADFHREWPNIDRNNPDHMRTVAQLSASFRHMNPSASMTDAIKYVGQAATAFLGLQMPARGGNGSRAAPAGVRRSVAPPFAPANGGGAQPPAGSPSTAVNPFSGLGQQFDE